MDLKLRELLWLPLVLLVLLAIYLPGLGNAIIFDDQLLTTGGLFENYGALLPLKPRLLSYGSFVWLHELFGDGWWKQRLFNLLLHTATVLALWAFYREVTRFITPPVEHAGLESRPLPPYHLSPALGLAVGFFAFNPVAVYAVAYLIQRSILMATLFVVLGLWSFARGLARGQRGLLALSLLSYLLAVMAKEHAIMAPLAAVPVYILVARPSGRRLAAIAAIGAVLVAIVGAVLAVQYGEIIGKPFDQFSKIYLAQLAALGPDVEKNAFALSILNQSSLFFRYGFQWLLPYSGWMAIDLRPPFPVSLTSPTYILALAGYLSVIVAGFFLIIRYRDWKALVGLSLLLPALLFVTEFSTVWVQDPYVLYRSYLWAIGIPGLILVLFHGFSMRWVAVLGVFIAAFFSWQALDRVFSLATPVRIWSDAIAKLPDDPRSVGRWFPYLSRGNLHLDAGRSKEAFLDFKASMALGDRGMGAFNMAAMIFMARNYEKALTGLDEAIRQGYDFPGLNYQRGAMLRELGRLPEAYREFGLAMAQNPASPQREETLALKGRTALELGKKDEAIQDLEAVLTLAPGHKEARQSLGLAYVMVGRNAEAHELLSKLLAEGAQGSVYYARALANYGLKNKTEALADIRNAISIGPDHPNFREWLGKIKAMP